MGKEPVRRYGVFTHAFFAELRDRVRRTAFFIARFIAFREFQRQTFLGFNSSRIVTGAF